MEPRQILILFRHEVRCALRERNIVVFSIVLPLVMYPLMLWFVFAGISFVEGQADRMHSRVAVLGEPPPGGAAAGAGAGAAGPPGGAAGWAGHAALLDSLEAHPRVSLEWRADREGALEAIDRGALDLLVELGPPPPGGEALPGNFTLRLSFSDARDRSRAARDRVREAAREYREAWMEGSRRELGLAEAEWADFLLVRSEAAGGEDMARFFLALVVPFLTLITVALAAFYPAIDATAGERERSTWETLMTVAAPPGAVAAAKYLYVAAFGTLGGLLNLTALALSLQWILRPLAGSEAGALAGVGIPLGALPAIAAGTALLGLFVAAGMLVFAVFARTFKEGQSMITPFYLVLILPAVFLQDPDAEFTVGLALVPAANVVVLIREAILGSLAPHLAAVTLASMAVAVALCVAFAQWVISREEVLRGAADGGLVLFLRRHFRSGGRKRP